MTRKCALIVDDSKTARQVLSKKLQAYQIDVETADSAVTAIDFLYSNTPDAVFMDYEMPGMDGFQALKIIKSNPKTATIPVMMYTSKEGGIALSQARALGAIGVLPKQMESRGLDAIIEQLHLHPHQRSLVENFHDENEQYAAKISYPSDLNPPSNVEYLDQKRALDERVEYPEEVLDESVFVLKRQTRIYLKELMSAEKRIAEKLSSEIERFRDELDSVVGLQEELTKRAKVKRGFPYLVYLLMLLAVGYLVWQQQVMQRSLLPAMGAGFIASDLSEIKNQLGRLTATVTNEPLGKDEEKFESDTETLEHQPNIEFLSWAANRGTGFQYGENPFNDVRVAWLSELVTQLNKAGFTGVISLKAHYGNFCLVKSGTGALILAGDDYRFEDCVFSADSQQAGFTQSSYQTLGFANYLNSIVSDKKVPIEVVVESDEYDDPAHQYPEPYALKAAGTWNKIAVQNQRIEVSLYPALAF